MLFKKLNINGVEFPLAVNQTGRGAPTGDTPGAVGVFYLDTDTGVVYKCTAVTDGVSTWREFKTAEGSGQNANGLSAEASALLIEILRNGVYSTDQSANITALAAELTVTEPEEPDTPVEPDDPVTPQKTLTSISATYSGGDVAVGTAVSDLTGIVVKAYYSDGTSETVTDYTLSGTIAEGSNTITVSYGGKTTTFAVTGVAEESEGQSVTMTAWAKAGDIKFNGKMYADDGSSGETVDFGSGQTKGTASEKTFDADTTVKVTLTNSGQTYASFCIGSTNDEVSKSMTIYHAEKFGSSKWENPSETEYTYTVKAGYRLVVLTNITECTVTVTEVE